MLARLTIVTILLAGCLATHVPAEQATAGYVSAKTLHRAALEEARRAWTPDARLNVVESLERANRSEFSTPTNLYRVLDPQSDPAPGDGRAYRWMFSFVDDTCDPDGPSHCGEYFVIVDGHGEIVLSRPGSSEEGTVVPFPWAQEWRLDSTDAAEKAAASNPKWEPPHQAPTFAWVQLSFLPRGGDERVADLAWRFSIGFGGDRGEIVNVNAETGEAWTEPYPPEHS